MESFGSKGRCFFTVLDEEEEAEEEEEDEMAVAEEGTVDGMATEDEEEVVEVAPEATVVEARAGKDTKFRGTPTAGWGDSLTLVLVELEVLSADKEAVVAAADVLLDEGTLPV